MSPTKPAPTGPDWGSRGAGRFTETQYSSPNAALECTKVSLLTPFIVCIVGASRGIGAGIAISYARAGVSGLVLSSRRISGLESTAAKCREINPKIEIEIVPCDITSAPDVAALAEKTKSRFGRLDVAAVNSGYSGPVVLKVAETDPETFFNATNVNYCGTFYCAKYLIPLLLATNDGARAFIGVSSLASLIVRGPIANAQYCVSKAAQLKLLEHVHEQYSAAGLGTFAVHPGAVMSEMADETAPEAFKQYLTDSDDLCGSFCVWLTKDGNKRSWLSGRLLSANWDVDELEARRGEIVERDLLKLQLSV